MVIMIIMPTGRIISVCRFILFCVVRICILMYLIQDYIIVGAGKPDFFEGGTTLREVNLQTGALEIRRIEKFEKGHVYNGGSMSVFSQLSGAKVLFFYWSKFCIYLRDQFTKGSDVLYVGDHIFSDVIVSKKTHRWRNLLVVRELENEIKIQECAETEEIRKRLEVLNYIFRETFKGLDSSSTVRPDVSVLKSNVKKAIATLDENYNTYFGSLFRTGSKNSFFA